MTKPTRRKPSSRKRPATPRARRASVLTVAAVLAVGLVAVVVLLRGGELGGTGSPQPSSAARRAHPPATGVATNAGVQALQGRWLQPDGGYILDIRDVKASGTLEAVYLNPRPIPVARAAATRDGAALQVFIELRAPGDPGSTDTLTDDPPRDRLAGISVQAALQGSKITKIHPAR